MTEEQIQFLQNYIERRASQMDGDILRYGDPKGKTVLAFGCGAGADILWCAMRGAKRILGIDLRLPSREPIDRALEKAGIKGVDYELRQQDIHFLAMSDEKFDLIVSNGTFEHVMDLKGVLLAFRSVLAPAGRIALLADGLWYSSVGGHLGYFTWDHLILNTSEIHDKYPDRFAHYLNSLNRMTIADFIAALYSVGLVVLQFQIKRDPLINQLRENYELIQRKRQISPTDMSISAIGCELCFPENIQGGPVHTTPQLSAASTSFAYENYETLTSERDALAAERDTLAAERDALAAERDVLAAASSRWFDAVIAVTADHNPVARAPRKQHRWWTNLARRLNGEYGRPSPAVLATRACDAGSWELAVRYYRDALDLEPHDPDIWVRCGYALQKAGKTSEAEIAYNRSRELLAAKSS